MNAQKVLSALKKSIKTFANKQTMMVIGVLIVIGILIGVSAYFYDDWFGEEDEDVITPNVVLNDCPEGETCSVINDNRWVRRKDSSLNDRAKASEKWYLYKESEDKTLKQCAAQCARWRNCSSFQRRQAPDEVPTLCKLAQVNPGDPEPTRSQDVLYDTYTKAGWNE